ncbi:MAG: YhjD/YihY/BrkB family envelope integrity protein [Pseudomonadota bacterium]
MDTWFDNLRGAVAGAVGSANMALVAGSRGSRLSFAVRVLRTVVREARDGQLSLRAMGLVYTTLLSLVPLLAVSFSVLKAFGVHNQLEPTLLNVLAPLGEQGIRITDQIVGFVENMKVGALGSLGLALLIYTVISLMQKIESALNFAWRIRRSRRLVDRFSRYLSVVLVGPVLVFSAMGIFASLLSSDLVQQLMAMEPFGALIRFFIGLLPYLLVIAAFAFVYAYIPNTRVKLSAAMTGGLVAGLLWASVGWAFAAFIVGSTSKWAAVYSSLAILMVFMVWVYVGWTVLLIGAAVAFYVQNPQYLGVSAEALRLGNATSERVGLLAMRRIATAFVQGAPPPSLTQLAIVLKVPLESLREVLGRLQKWGLLMYREEAGGIYTPARDLQSMTVADVLFALRAPVDGSVVRNENLPDDAALSAVFTSLDSAVSEAGAGMTMRDLALAESVSEVTAETGSESLTGPEPGPSPTTGDGASPSPTAPEAAAGRDEERFRARRHR